MEEVIRPKVVHYQNLLRNLQVPQAQEGPVLAAQLRLLEGILEEVEALAERRANTQYRGEWYSDGRS